MSLSVKHYFCFVSFAAPRAVEASIILVVKTETFVIGLPYGIRNPLSAETAMERVGSETLQKHEELNEVDFRRYRQVPNLLDVSETSRA
jgi:hypothetical protein